MLALVTALVLIVRQSGLWTKPENPPPAKETELIQSLIDKLKGKDCDLEDLAYPWGLPEEIVALGAFLPSHSTLISASLTQSGEPIHRLWDLYIHGFAGDLEYVQTQIAKEKDARVQLFAYDLISTKGSSQVIWITKQDPHFFMCIKQNIFHSNEWIRWRTLMLWKRVPIEKNTEEGKKLVNWVVENDPSERNVRVAERISQQ